MHPHRRITMLLGLVFVILVSSTVILGRAQLSGDLVSLSYQAFEQTSKVYVSGGTSRELVAQMKEALGQMQEAQARRSQGDEVGAAGLEAQASAALEDVLNKASSAQLAAEKASQARSLNTYALAAVADVVIITVSFLLLKSWRSYEKKRLYGMRIVAKETKA